METQVLVYKFGLLPPTGESRERVMQALRDAHILYNQTLEAHNARFATYIALDEGFPEILALREQRMEVWTSHQELEARINEELGNQPAQGKPQAVDRTQVLQAQAKDLSAKLKSMAKDLKALRAVRNEEPRVALVLAEASASLKARITKLRQDSPLECTTAVAVIDAANQAATKAKGQPRFHRWSGEGTLELQLPQSLVGGLRYQTPHLILTDQPPAKKGWGPNPFVQIDPVDPRAWERGLTKGQRKYHQRTRLRFRTGHEGRAPHWAEFPMIMHRPFPDHASVCRVAITCKKVGPREIWSVQFSLKIPDSGELPLPETPKGVGIDWGWRKKPGEGYRVAYWADTEGDRGEFILPLSVITKIEHANSIRGTRDKNLDVLKARLMEDLKGKRDQLSPELRDRVKALHQWKSPRRFATLWFKHGGELPLSDEGDTEAFRADKHTARYCNYFEAWLHRDRHLWQYEAGARRSAYAHRNWLYQNWAVKLASKYDVLSLENIKLPNLAKTPPPENKAHIPNSLAAMKNASARQRSWAAVGTLRGFVIKAGVSAKKTVVKADAKNTSCIHHACGLKVNVGAQLHPTCPHCEVIFDRDHNAAMNILARGLVATKTPEALAGVNLKQKRGVSKRWAARDAAKTIKKAT